MKKKFFAFCFILFFVFSLSGCDENIFDGLDDDDSEESQLEEARTALNDEDYNKALEILSDLDPCDPDVAKYTSSAYMGRANFNTLDLLENVAELSDEDEAGNIDMISSVFDSDGDGQITRAEIIDGIEEVLESIDAMTHLINNCGEIPITCDETTLLGVAGALHVTYIILEAIQEDLGQDPIPVSEEGIDIAYEGREFVGNNVTDAQLQALNNGIGYMKDAIECIRVDEDENDLAENFDDYLREIDSDGNGQITIVELENYIDSMGD